MIEEQFKEFDKDETTDEEEDFEEPVPQWFEITFHDGKTVKAFGFLMTTHDIVAIGDAKGRLQFSAHHQAVHHVVSITEPVALSLVKN